MLETLKAATVFVRVDMGRVAGTGSGFLIEKKGDYAYIVTNEHVVRQEGRVERTVEVDFSSGTKNRRSFEATVLSEDPYRDLAVLRITNHKELPKPIALKSTQKVRETQSVFIFGFPFGEALATNRLGPNVTIGKGTVSSLRTEDLVPREDLEPGEDGRWSKISTKMKRIRLTVEGQTAVGEKDFRGDFGERIRIIHQVRYENGRGETVYTGPGKYIINIPKRARKP